MDGVPYPQPLSGHEPQYVPWGVLLVRPIGHPPRTVPPGAADPRFWAYSTFLRVLRWGRYGHRGGVQTPEAGPLACVPCGHLSSRPIYIYIWGCWLPCCCVGCGISAPRPRFFPSRASPPAPGLLPCPACPSLSPSALPRTGTMHDSFRAGFRLGLRMPSFRLPCMLHDTLPPHTYIDTYIHHTYIHAYVHTYIHTYMI